MAILSPAGTKPRHRSALRAFLSGEAAGGLVLMAAAALALIVANSALAPLYFGLLKAYVGPLSLGHWINDGLMAVFFLFIGLEIKREVLDGQLSTWSRRVLPGVGALGGMLVPALIFVAFNAGDPTTLRGWAIPTATDIAFALGVLSLLGPRVPVSLKVFLTALAIIDDLGAVIIIAIFYTADVSTTNLLLAGGTLAALMALNLLRVTRLWLYMALGLVLWFFVLRSGVHATVAGVLLAFTIPLRPTPGAPEALDSPLHILEHGLQPWVAFLVVPVFGFANAGISFSGLTAEALFGPLTLGVALGLLVGKVVGVFGFATLAIRLGLADMPSRATTSQLLGIALLCGIGFTMSLFIGSLAFEAQPALQDATKLGILGGSAIAGVLGWLILRLAAPRTS